MTATQAESALPKIIISAGDPAGIGPDIIALAVQQNFDAVISVAGDPSVLAERADQIGQPVSVLEIDPAQADAPHQPGQLNVIPVRCASAVAAGQLDAANAPQVIDCINLATDLCIDGRYQAMVTAPVHKAAINDGGIEFSGHTEWIAGRCGDTMPVMMLASPEMRVCLATTHLPLSEVPAAITADRLKTVISIMHSDLARLYRYEAPAIGVCGLNPHAGESGYLGMEEIEVIEPLIKELNRDGFNLVGPLPADTAFTLDQLNKLDAVLAMYHDQGLPVIKHQGFGNVVNVTLGLPIIRTSVDHGTALSLAGSGDASADSLVSSIRLAIQFARNKSQA